MSIGFLGDIKVKDSYHKKGQAEMAVGSIIVLIVGVGVAVLVLIFIGALGGQTFNLVEPDIADIADNTVAGSTYTAANATTHQLAHSFVQEGSLTVTNSSNTLVGLSNFTINYDLGQITLTNNLFDGQVLTTNYTWGNAEIRNNVLSSIGSGFDAMNQSGNYLPIIVLAIVIGLVLALVLGFTVGGGNMGGKSTVL